VFNSASLVSSEAAAKKNASGFFDINLQTKAVEAKEHAQRDKTYTLVPICEWMVA
jgi:hypothetical protein